MDLDNTIAIYRQALRIGSPTHPYRSNLLTELGNFLLTRYQQSSRIGDLQDSILAFQSAITLRPPGNRDRPATLLNFGIALRTRYELLGKMEDLENVVLAHREAMRTCHSDQPEYHLFFLNFAGTLTIRYQRLGNISDLEEAITMHRRLLSLCPAGHPDRPLAAINFGSCLRSRYERLGEMKDLEDALSLSREARSLVSHGHPDEGPICMNLATILRDRYEHLGVMKDLEDAILLYNNSLGTFPPNHPDRPLSLMNLSSVIFYRYLRLGRVEDLESAIATNRESLGIQPPSRGATSSATTLMNLGTCLRTRYERLGRVEDLEEAILSHTGALTLYPPGSQQRALSLMCLATSLFKRYGRYGNLQNLEDCISMNEEALSITSSSHPVYYQGLMNLANALFSRFQKLDRVEDLDLAISSHRKALGLRPLGNTDRPMSLMNLANAFYTRYKRLNKLEDLEDAICFHREALSLCPPDNPNRCLSLLNLANALWSRFQRSNRQEECDETFQLYEQATNDVMSFAEHRLKASHHWTQAAQECHHHTLLLACRSSLDLLNRCLVFLPNVESQQRFIATASGTALMPKSLASESASASIKGGNLELAVELLEHGRAILWSKVNSFSYPLEQLRQVEGGGQLADRLETLNAELEHLVLLSGKGTLDEKPTSAIAFDAQMKRHRILSGEREEVVAAIRRMEGFENFLQPHLFTDLRLAAAEGPVIIINISRYRCDAIILLISDSPILVPLPQVQLTELQEQATKLRTSREITGVLRFLWDKIVHPIIDQLSDAGVPKGSRIWWCPTSELCSLPLHAAGPYRRGEINLPDLYTSSYTPTLSALIRARSNIIQRKEVPTLLVVGHPDDKLQQVGEEVKSIRQLTEFSKALIGREATRDAVLKGLKEHPWVHFACHGNLGDDLQPFQASFQLHDRRLPLLDIIRAKLPNAELAFLSACFSAGGDAFTPDETIHLAAALQFCGFRSVVGTLWEMNDEDGPFISREFYKYMFRHSGKTPDFKDSAEGLNSAIRAMRKNQVPVERWVMFVHIGA